MPNKTKILSDLSKIAVDAMGTFSGVKNELETVIKLRVNKAINKLNLVKREEFEVLKKIVQKLSIELEKEKTQKKTKKRSLKTKKRPKNKKKIK